ncbi:MAG: hypothetical protein A2504_09515 [Bdellovibrionales bacterium RIFOXYD12_FULL_39_22]|nr:MAG: hypothetical protein A2385_13005 [Bdellovibrionales bacterium RIFOXYB1_FULL_39_21]OFZ40964.1 MAG: hypothetical protein A2485_16515 [Bdellovibrionales bacterium RIFOXYC12_FULL_39_17]OFZ44792.1 MAG: hypothetical protein A2404_09805 [Bdellovibrionales bacterium RIFOXYC1_FULL_39_130]OFZ73593.1 MAG: hypothetical protein A2451_06455 [Bdellovibrionales bacterium RIFOXYC2_FULL_39_8]OFZ74257.1 MAG: hypothetical protein A2560_16770 [Bdellovibrionales bacterium RIFOXYD1_FULL_39_84]OFZ92121.1 MAG:
MKSILLAVLFLSQIAFADVYSITGRVYTGYVSPEISPFGAIVDLDSGEVLYVTSLISVLSPKNLDKGCRYEFNYVLDTTVPFKAIKLVPPQSVIDCANDFPADR